MSVRDLVILGSSSQQPTRHRNHGAYLFRWNDEGLLFDPGEGTQRQFIFANVAPPTVTRMFVSHFHGDHCLGVGSMFMRLNIDGVKHPIQAYYPGSGRRYWQRLRFGTIYHDRLEVHEHPVRREGLVQDDGKFRIECRFLEHGVETLGWRVTEPDERKFDKEKLRAVGIRGPMVRELLEHGRLKVGDRLVLLDDVSWMRPGDSIAVIADTRYCQQAVDLARGVRLMLCESTYTEEHRDLASRHLHMTARQAAEIAQEAGVDTLVLTHFSARYLDTRLFLEEAQAVFPNTIVAEDLKVIPFPKK